MLLRSLREAPLNPTCFPCPEGGVCMGAARIVSLPNFWGLRTVSSHILYSCARCQHKIPLLMLMAPYAWCCAVLCVGA